LKQRFQKTHRIDPYFIALHFGGDYELLVTLPPQKMEQTRHRLQKHGIAFTWIGTVTEKKKIILRENGKTRILPNKGYEHFKKHIF
jgi:thiamine monophosphate kinase